MMILLRLLLFLPIALIVRCGDTSSGPGNSSETIAMIGGQVFTSNGSAAKGVQVDIHRSDYLGTTDVPTPPICTTDKFGRFSIKKPEAGSYSIEVNDWKSSACLFACTVSEGPQDVELKTDTLRPYAKIEGTIPLPSMQTGPAFVRIYGLDRYVPVGQSGAFSIPDLPQGTFRLQVVSASPSVKPLDIDSVNAVANTTAVVPYIGWHFHKKLRLNTSATGANVGGLICDFPVLVRLTASRFSFSDANSDGSDLRFTKADNSELSYEIERWDPLQGKADIWVKVDTIFGLDSTQFITMHWGNPSAASVSNGTAVFDTSNGFTGIWHLNNGGSDATSNNHDGSVFGAAGVEGIIGNAKKFRGVDSIKIPGLLGKPQNLTISAWAELDSLLTAPGVVQQGAEIFSLGDAAKIRMDDSGSFSGSKGIIGSYHFNNNDTQFAFLQIRSNLVVKKTGWHFVAFTIDKTLRAQSLYIDGILVRKETYPDSINYTKVGTDSYIGVHGNRGANARLNNIYNFIGTIDEVRVKHTVDSPDWISLCAMNQKEPDQLVVW